MHLISHNSFAVNGSLNESLFWKDRIHTNKRGLQHWDSILSKMLDIAGF